METHLGDSRRISEGRPFLSARTVEKEKCDLIIVRRRLSFGIFPSMTNRKEEFPQALDYGESEGSVAWQKATGYKVMLVVVLELSNFR